MSGSEFEFRFAEGKDIAILAEILLEATRHYWGEREDAAEMASKASDALVNGRSGCRVLLALEAGVLKGFATASILHPAPNEHGTLFMKDLFVSKSARGVGLGELLMRQLAQHAVELGCHRFDWTAETDNPRAISFYDELTAERVEEKVYFRFSGAKLREFAGAVQN